MPSVSSGKCHILVHQFNKHTMFHSHAHTLVHSHTHIGEICISDCVIGELERLGEKFKVALRVAKDPRFVRLTCQHKGIYADDCLCRRVEANPVYIVATCDKDLKRRIRKIPGVPIMFIKARKYTIERLPDVSGMGLYTMNLYSILTTRNRCWKSVTLGTVTCHSSFMATFVKPDGRGHDRLS